MKYQWIMAGKTIINSHKWCSRRARTITTTGNNRNITVGMIWSLITMKEGRYPRKYLAWKWRKLQGSPRIGWEDKRELAEKRRKSLKLIKVLVRKEKEKEISVSKEMFWVLWNFEIQGRRESKYTEKNVCVFYNLLHISEIYTNIFKITKKSYSHQRL